MYSKSKKAREKEKKWLRKIEDGDKMDSFEKVHGINGSFPSGKTYLTEMVRHAPESHIKRLFDMEGVDPNLEDSKGRTPLSCAAKRGTSSVVELLLKKEEIEINHPTHLGRTPLSLAAERGNETVLQLLLKEENIKPDFPDEDGRTPLLWASAKYPAKRDSWWKESSWRNENSDPEAIVKLLLQRKDVNPNATDESGWTPLTWAAKTGRQWLADLLLQPEVHVDPNCKDKDGRTPLWWAATEGYETIVRSLLNSVIEIDPNSVDDSGKTSLISAISCKKVEVVRELLLDERVDPLYAGGGHTPLWLVLEQACKSPPDKKSVEIFKLLIDLRKEVEPDTIGNDSQTPLLRASKIGNEALVQHLLSKESVNENLKDASGRTPLSWAAEGGHQEVVFLLLEKLRENAYKGLDLHDNNGFTPLMWAAQKGHGDTVKILLETNAVNPNAQDKQGRTVLMWAAGNHHESVVKILLAETHINPNLQAKDGQTPLSWTIQKVLPNPWYTPEEYFREFDSIVELLLQNGAHPDLVDNENRTPLSWAVEFREIEYTNIWNIFLAQKPQNRTSLSWAAEIGDFITASDLVRDNSKLGKKRHIPDLYYPDGDGRTPLWRAAKNRHERLVKLFIPMDDTTLLTLVEEDDRESAELLLRDESCAVNTKDGLGRSPLHIALLRENLEIAEDLIRSRADVNARDQDGATPLRLSIDRRLGQEIITLLLEKGADPGKIKASKWYKACGRDTPDVFHLLEAGEKETTLRFISPGQLATVLNDIQVNKTEQREILVFTDSSSWEDCLIPGIQEPLENKPLVVCETPKTREPWKTFSLIASVPPAVNSEPFASGNWCKHAITWTMIYQSGERTNSMWKSVKYFSTLPNGWIPENHVVFFTQFTSSLGEKWLHICNQADDHLSQRRHNQLIQKGENPDTISYLADDACTWIEFRTALREQVRIAKAFAEEHHPQYINDKELRCMQDAIGKLSDDVESRLNALDQTVRDLLQFEFAWVSVMEAHKSTSLSVSLKRLSWITFIFLPPMFAATLFGMNVDVLANNPDWRWYPLFGGSFLLLTLAIWLFFFSSINFRTRENMTQIWNKLQPSVRPDWAVQWASTPGELPR